MKLAELQRLTGQQPFRPFVIVLSDNAERLTVSRADQLDFPREQIVVWREGNNGNKTLLFEASSVFALQL